MSGQLPQKATQATLPVLLRGQQIKTQQNYLSLERVSSEGLSLTCSQLIHYPLLPPARWRRSQCAVTVATPWPLQHAHHGVAPSTEASQQPWKIVDADVLYKL